MCSKFGEDTTAMEVVEGISLKGYEVIVTGGNSGIGIETIRALAKAGARCVLSTRDLEKGHQVAKELIAFTGNDQIEVELLELDSLESVDNFVQRFLAKNRPLNILVNNAGVMACPKSFTKNGFETQFGVNHMGHFALTVGLLPALKEGAKLMNNKSRVVNVSSTAHAFQNVDFNDIHFTKGRKYEKFLSYGQSKTCNCLFSLALTKRFFNDGIASNSVMPGVIMTNLGRHIGKDFWIERELIDENGKLLKKFKTIEAGASTSVWAAVSPELEGKSGLYLENCSVGKEEADIKKIHTLFVGYAPYIMNEEAADKLWNISEELLRKRSI
ncbi:probable oxidoreductase [Hydra vulgaris]|uniref:probable oxidoreductase n=1 Tax=Hydra vulgaris TaxID=6087 RepID=UPI000192529A|nr:probable oxidoreductase [Hydra vulgaris]